MFANIGNLIKKLISLFIVGADNTIKAIKELYCVGADGKIHKIPFGETLVFWRANLYSKTEKDYGGCITNENEIYVYSNTDDAVMAVYTVTIPADYVRPTGNMFVVKAKLHTVNSLNSYATLAGAMGSQNTSDGVTNLELTRRINSNTTNITISAYRRARKDAPVEAWLTDVTIDGVPIKFYE